MAKTGSYYSDIASGPLFSLAQAGDGRLDSDGCRVRFGARISRFGAKSFLAGMVKKTKVKKEREKVARNSAMDPTERVEDPPR